MSSRRRGLRHTVTAALALALLTSVSVSSLRAATATTAAAEAARAAAPTEEEAAQFGRWMVERIDADEFKEITRLFDATSFMRLVAAGLDLPENQQQEIGAGLRSSFAQSLERDLASFESAHFLRVQTRGTERRVLLRLLHEDGSANYMAFVTAKRTDGGLKWIDAFSYLSGEKFTESARRLILPLLAEQKKSLLEKLTSGESALVKNMPAIQRAIGLVHEQKMEEAYAIFSKLPAELRKEKFILLLEMRASQTLSEDLYLKTLEALQAIAPNDGSLDLALLDGHFLRNDFAGALKRLASFEKEIGGDPYLTYLKANTHIAAENYPAANEAARAALAREPDLLQAYDALLTIAVKQNKHEDTAAVLKEVEAKNPAIDMLPVINDDETYTAFRASPAFKDWVASRPKRPASTPEKPSPAKAK